MLNYIEFNPKGTQWMSNEDKYWFLIRYILPSKDNKALIDYLNTPYYNDIYVNIHNKSSGFEDDSSSNNSIEILTLEDFILKRLNIPIKKHKHKKTIIMKFNRISYFTNDKERIEFDNFIKDKLIKSKKKVIKTVSTNKNNTIKIIRYDYF
jgi:hypothetical protein